MLKYPESFVKKVKKVIEFHLSETKKLEILNALDNDQGKLRGLLEELSKMHYFSPEQIKDLFAVGAEKKILLSANFAMACSELLREWNLIYSK